MLYTIGDKKIQINGNNYFIADNATVIGSVIIDNNVSIWYNVVIRADLNIIIIGENSNIQDGTILHTDKGFKLEIGKGVSIGHNAVLHGCIIGDNTLIGINSVILNGAYIGKNCIIGANTLILEKEKIPDNSLVIGSPGKVIKKVSEEQIKIIENAALHYVERITEYKNNLKPVKIL